MSKDNNCNLVEDLLPLYVEGLVSKETNKEIEEHLKKCNKCSEALNNIKKDNAIFLSEEDITREQNNNKEKEIKCIRSIKRKIILKIMIAILITVITVTGIFVLYILSPYRFIRDENNKLILYNFNTGNIRKGMEATNVIATYKYDNNGERLEYYTILTFNKNNICVNARTIITGFNKNEMNNYKNTWERNNIISNTRIENEELYMNDNSYLGKTRKQLLQSLKASYNAEIIEI